MRPQEIQRHWQCGQSIKQMNLDASFIFTRAPGSSAYNPVERRMEPLSKTTASVILPFDTFGSHLNSVNKTTDIELEVKNVQAAGDRPLSLSHSCFVTEFLNALINP